MTSTHIPIVRPARGRIPIANSAVSFTPVDLRPDSVSWKTALDVLKQRSEGRPWACFIAHSLIPGVRRDVVKERLKVLRSRGLVATDRCNCRAFVAIHTRVTFLPPAEHVVTDAGEPDFPPARAAPVTRQTARQYVHQLLKYHADRELTSADINNELPDGERYDRSTLSAAIRRLHERGLIEEVRENRDRASYWRITPYGMVVEE